MKSKDINKETKEKKMIKIEIEKKIHKVRNLKKRKK